MQVNCRHRTWKKTQDEIRIKNKNPHRYIMLEKLANQANQTATSLEKLAEVARKKTKQSKTIIKKK